MKRKIVFFDAKPYDIESFESHLDPELYSLSFVSDRLSENTASMMYGADAISLFVNDKVTEEIAKLIDSYNITLIALRCAGYNNIDLKAVYDRHIHVVRVPAYSPYAVAEHATALLMALNRKTHKAYNRTRESNFNISGLTGFDLHGKTVGVIGAGKIGRIMVSIMKGFGTEILIHDRYEDPVLAADPQISFTDLETLYKRSDIITLHCPLTEGTYHLIDEKALNLMKDKVILINTSRGQLIKTSALVEGLKTEKIGGAGLDVYEEESQYFFHDYSLSHIDDDNLARLLSFNNVLITSHQAFLTKEALTNIAMTTFENLKAFFGGAPLANEVCYRCDKECVKETKGRCF